MKSAIFISVRTKSKRLPKKALLEIKGKTVVEHLVDRLKLAKIPDLIVLCTSTNPDDDILIDIARRNGIEYFRGSEDDVLYRYFKAAETFGVDFIVVALGDAIFCDPEYIDKTIKLFEKTNADFIKIPDLPIGSFTYGLKVEAVRKVCQIKDEEDTEVWGDYFTKSGIFNVKDLEVEEELKHPEVRLVIDYPEDFNLVKEIFERLYEKEKIITLKGVLRLLKEKPELMDTNKECQKMYKENLKKAPKAKFKKDILKLNKQKSEETSL